MIDKMIDKEQIRRVKQICSKVSRDLQAVFDEMNADTYATTAIDSAVQVQSYAVDVIENGD